MSKKTLLILSFVIISCAKDESNPKLSSEQSVQSGNVTEDEGYKKRIDDFLRTNQIDETENREELFGKLDKMTAAFSVLNDDNEKEYFKSKSKDWYKSFSMWRDDITFVELQQKSHFTIKEAESYALKKYDGYRVSSYKDLLQKIDSSGNGMTLKHSFALNLAATGLFNSDKQTVTIHFITSTANKKDRVLKFNQNYTIDGFEIMKKTVKEWQ